MTKREPPFRILRDRCSAETVYVLLAGISILAIGCKSGPPAKPYYHSRAIELRKELRGDCDRAWQEVVSVVKRERWPIEISDKKNRYLKTGWIYNSRSCEDRGSFTLMLKCPPGPRSNIIELRTQAQHQGGHSDEDHIWRNELEIKGMTRHHRTFNLRVFYILANELGQTMLNE